MKSDDFAIESESQLLKDDVKSVLRIGSAHNKREIRPMICQLSHVVKSVRVCEISELRQVPSLAAQSWAGLFFIV